MKIIILQRFFQRSESSESPIKLPSSWAEEALSCKLLQTTHSKDPEVKSVLVQGLCRQGLLHGSPRIMWLGFQHLWLYLVLSVTLKFLFYKLKKIVNSTLMYFLLDGCLIVFMFVGRYSQHFSSWLKCIFCFVFFPYKKMILIWVLFNCRHIVGQ